MYSKAMGNHRGGEDPFQKSYRRPLYIPPNYSGTAVEVSPPPPYTSLPSAESPPPFSDLPVADDRTEEAVLHDTEDSPPEATPPAVQTPVSPAHEDGLRGLLSAGHFPFGHGLGYEELLLLGLILFLMREGEADGNSEDDLSLPLLMLGALLFLG